MPYGSLLGAYTNAALLEGVHIFRTLTIQETKFLTIQLAKKCQTTAQAPSRGLASKRKKDSSLENIWIRQLTCIPSISEGIAIILLQQFGTMSKLKEALEEDPRHFPQVPLSRGACLGKARINKLREVLLQ